MGFNSVYRSLMEIFPQVDARILRAVAIEHPKDADEAVGVVLSEIVPSLPSNLACKNKSSRSSPDNGGTIPLVVDSDNNITAACTESVSTLNKGDQMDECLSKQKNSIPPRGCTKSHRCRKCCPVPYEAKTLDISGELGVYKTTVATTVAVAPESIQLIDNGWQDLDSNRAGKFNVDGYESHHQAESSSSASSENPVHKLVVLNLGEHSANAQQISGSSNITQETSNGSLTSENGDAELGGPFSAIINRSNEACSIDHLEEIIEDAKSNKKTLFAVMESVMNLMREVEVQEKDAEKAKKESALGGLDTLNKVEELKKMLEHAREANDMHAGEVYGEKSILATEVKELENRLLNLSEERDKSLAILDEMREVLEARLAAALEMKKAAEQENHEKEDYAKKAFAEQEAIMEQVVKESKLLQQEAEENSKLREFLMDRGQIVDSLQGEISVICQDVRLLKEKFDERVPLSQSISSSQTSCRLASSASSLVNLLDKSGPEPSSYEKPMILGNKEDAVPAASPLNKEADDDKELLEDGWDIC
ncbi:PREDICTED: uncharacterized protein LOC104801219 [Tarenaya hassleriana]|uniref:uncharacterized protein LOC104801219 n=1 Tax=Tarenaya hassleriana TaxID=28532 RepID=UPI00053C7785|nr:PREDICTED: uncharacterized protein LOC104801219 [Tarenaya hassleriana]XP_010522694.1 PREDICTED: uncharacterized protein LOC104801219 [Tarenaya hassleriana]